MPAMKNSVVALLVIVLFLAWMVPGLIGRDLWKADEPYSFGLADHIADTGEWTVPALAGEPFMEKPPLFYITAAGFVRLMTPWLKPHDAARLATFFFMMLTVLFLGLTARELSNKRNGWIAVIILIGCSGLQITAHKLITDVALLAGFSIAFFGLALGRRRSVSGGLWLGIGTGVGFLSKGLLAPGIIGVTALVLPLLNEWRNKRYFSTLLVAVPVSAPWLVIWPYALYKGSPFLFKEWLWYQNLGRFLGFAHVGRQFSSASYFSILPWFALPALPLALWTLWSHRGSWRRLPAGILFALVAFAVMFLVLSISSSIRDLYALPMLLPLTLLAAAGADPLPDRARRSLHSFNLIFFGLLGLVLWAGWLVMMAGTPSSAALKLRELQPGYTPSVNMPLFVGACIYTLAWVVAVIRFRRADSHPAMTWTAGMILSWALVMTLWLPWLDAGSGYHDLFSSLRAVIPENHGLVASEGIGESERALLEYYGGLLTERTEVNKNPGNANFFLVEGKRDPKNYYPEAEWRLIWEKQRGGNKPKEIYRLYQRIDSHNGKNVKFSSSGKKQPKG